MNNTQAESLAHLVQLAGIQKVIWVDDLFDPITRPSDATVADLLAQFQQTMVAPIDIPTIGQMDLGFDVDDKLLRFLELSDSDLMRALAPIKSSIGQQLEDYSSTQLMSVAQSFGNLLEKVGFAQWDSKRKELALSAETLVLFDYQSSPDRTPGIDGKVVFEHLLLSENKQFYMVLLTHTVSDGEQEERLRRDMMDGKKITHRFAVMAKSPQEADVTSHLRKKIRSIVTHRSFYALTEHVSSVMTSALTACTEAMVDQSITHLDHVIFENSLLEGASEIDVIARLLNLRQRTAIEDSLADNAEWSRSLERLRALRKTEKLPKAVTPQSQEFIKWRREEHYRVGASLNAAHAPLSCGDIFQVGDGKKFILLAQPCEVIIRSDGESIGKRRFEEGILVEVRSGLGGDSLATKEGTLQPGPLAPELFRIPALDGSDSWFLDFRRWATINLMCLDLAVFNQDGTVMLRIDSKCPDVLMPGWKKRFEQRKKELVTAISAKTDHAVQSVCYLSMSSLPGRNPLLLKEGPSNPKPIVGIKFNYRRIASLREPLSLAAYTAFSTYRTRPAYPHDFTRGLEPDSKPAEKDEPAKKDL